MLRSSFITMRQQLLDAFVSSLTNQPLTNDYEELERSVRLFVLQSLVDKGCFDDDDYHRLVQRLQLPDFDRWAFAVKSQFALDLVMPYLKVELSQREIANLRRIVAFSSVVCDYLGAHLTENQLTNLRTSVKFLECVTDKRSLSEFSVSDLQALLKK